MLYEVITGLGVDARSFRVALAARDLAVSPRIRDDHRGIAIGFRADAAGAFIALGAVLSREALPLGGHARVHAILGARRKLRPVDPDVGDLDPEGFDLGAGPVRDLRITSYNVCYTKLLR